MKKFIAILSILALAAAIGCSKKETTAPEQTADEIIASAWTAFESGDYTTALSDFNSAIAKDGNKVEAYNGKGWCLGITRDLDGATIAFQTGLNLSLGDNNLLAGLAFVYAGKDQTQQAIYNAHNVDSTSSGSWQLGHKYPASKDGYMNASDLRLLVAQGHYRLGHFQQSYDQVRIINPGFSITSFSAANPNHLSALLMELERLGTII